MPEAAKTQDGDLDALALAAQEGDPEACDRVARWLYAQIWCFIRRQGLFVPGAERTDLAQYAIERFWAVGLPAWRPDLGRFGPYAFCILQLKLREGLTNFRRQKHRILSASMRFEAPVHLGNDGKTLLLQEVLRSGSDPVDEVIMAEAREYVHDLLRRANMTRLERAATLMVFLDDLTYDQAGAVLGAGKKAIDNAIWRAKRKVRRVMG